MNNQFISFHAFSSFFFRADLTTNSTNAGIYLMHLSIASILPFFNVQKSSPSTPSLILKTCILFPPNHAHAFSYFAIKDLFCKKMCCAPQPRNDLQFCLSLCFFSDEGIDVSLFLESDGVSTMSKIETRRYLFTSFSIVLFLLYRFS